MQLTAAHQPPGNVSCLQERALRWKMGSQITCNRNKDMPTLVAAAPLAKLPYTGFEHLVGMKTGILAQYPPRERCDQLLRRVA